MPNANIPNTTRKAVYRRDGWQCALCGNTRYLQIHHYVPRGEGGSDDPMNLITLCSVCHAQIHGYIPFEDVTFTVEDMEQAVVEYLADFYVDDWYPFK